MTVEYAPAPSKGLALALYETVQAMRGPATEAQIKELLPAAITSPQKAGLTTEKIVRTLYWCVYSGFLVRTEDGERYQIAPLSYYVKRREYIALVAKQYQERKALNGDVLRPGEEDDVVEAIEHRAFDYALAAVSFLVGLFTGMAVVFFAVT